ncbi:hypothetical protein F5B20DRAFT_580638 [Whalleya microplaca]|nr:hypothetical protein F5B20DRAFT_580638 [Whalleya microplaca]
MANLQLTEEQKARFEAWTTPMISTGLALASWMPEVDTAALVQFVDSPMVQLAFLEFERDIWLKIPDTRNATPPARMPYRRCIKMKEWETAVSLFTNNPLERYHLQYLEANMSTKDDWKVEDHIALFWGRIYTWVTNEVKDLPIRPYLLDGNQRIPILAGVLAACIRVHGKGQFPDPPTKSWGHRRVEFHPGWFAMIQEWRIRHASGDPDASQRLLYLAQKTSAEYTEKALESDTQWFQLFLYRAKLGFDLTGEFHGEDNWEWRCDVGFFAPPTQEQVLDEQVLDDFAELQ